MRKVSPKQAKIIRFVLGPTLIVAGLFFWNAMIGEDLRQMISEAYQAGDQPNIDFTFMLKGIAPLVVVLVGFKLATWKSLGRPDD